MNDETTSVALRFPEPMVQRNFGAIVRMNEKTWHAAITIFMDGQGHICRARANPDRPVLIELEGKEPTPEQLETLRSVISTLRTDFEFNVWRFCDALLPHAKTLLSVN